MKKDNRIIKYIVTYQGSPSEYHMFDRVKGALYSWYEGLKKESKQILSFQLEQSNDKELMFGDIRTSCYEDHVQTYNVSDFPGSSSLMKVITSDFLNFQKRDPNWYRMNYVIEIIMEFEPEEVLPEYYDQFALNRKTIKSNETKIAEPADQQNNEGY